MQIRFTSQPIKARVILASPAEAMRCGALLSVRNLVEKAQVDDDSLRDQAAIDARKDQLREMIAQCASAPEIFKQWHKTEEAAELVNANCVPIIEGEEAWERLLAWDNETRAALEKAPVVQAIAIQNGMLTLGVSSNEQLTLQMLFGQASYINGDPLSRPDLGFVATKAYMQATGVNQETQIGLLRLLRKQDTSPDGEIKFINRQVEVDISYAPVLLTIAGSLGHSILRYGELEPQPRTTAAAKFILPIMYKTLGTQVLDLAARNLAPQDTDAVMLSNQDPEEFKQGQDDTFTLGTIEANAEPVWYTRNLLIQNIFLSEESVDEILKLEAAPLGWSTQHSKKDGREWLLLKTEHVTLDFQKKEVKSTEQISAIIQTLKETGHPDPESAPRIVHIKKTESPLLDPQISLSSAEHPLIVPCE